MNVRAFYIINGISLYRLVTAPLLLFFIWISNMEMFKWFLAVSFFTDAIDGFFARKYKVVSVMGAKLDSIADDLTIAMAVTGMLIFKPSFFWQHLNYFIFLFILFLLQAGIALARYRKITSFHTYAAKIAAVLQGIFLLLLFFTDRTVPLIFYTAVIVTAVQIAEEIILVIILPKWQPDIKGLYWLLLKKKCNLLPDNR